MLRDRLARRCNRGTVSSMAIAACCLQGCVHVPAQGQLITLNDAQMVRQADAGCVSRWPAEPASSVRAAGLDPAGFRLLSWNVYKGRDRDWPETLSRLGPGQDLILLQEAHLTEPFRRTLERLELQWSMAHAFDYRGSATGVLTATRTLVPQSCLQRDTEPLLRTPKSVLVSRHELEGTGMELLLVNLHGINLTTGTDGYREQLVTLAALLRRHPGPLILAGDFNNWSDRRTEILHEVAAGLDLVPLSFPEDRRSRHWGEPVDHIFYRGLVVLSAETIETSASDHNPLLAEFSVADSHRETTQ